MSGLKHAFASAKPDGGDATQVQPSNWNADHDLSGLTPADLPVAIRPPTVHKLPNDYTTQFLGGAIATSRSLSVDDGAVYPIVIPFGCTIEASIRVSSASAGSGGRFTAALYQPDGSGVMTKVIQFNEFNTASTGTKFSGDTHAVTPGLYWVYWKAGGEGFSVNHTNSYATMFGIFVNPDSPASRITIDGSYNATAPSDWTGRTLTPSGNDALNAVWFRVT